MSVKMLGKKNVVLHKISCVLGERGRFSADTTINGSFQQMFDQSSLGAAIVSLDLRCRRVNKKLCLITGYTETELTSMKFSDMIPPEDRGAEVESAKKLEAGEIDHIEGEKRYIRKDGLSVWTHLSVRLLKDAEGRPLYFLPVIADITRYKNAEQKVMEIAEEKLVHTMEKLRKAMGGIIQAMALTVETRDPCTSGHQRRVADLARAIAQEIGLSEERVDGIRMAGAIHDLGKISVPSEILSKPTRLTDLEYSLIKCHPTVGYTILKDIEFPWPIARIILQHHERINGSGYPEGISGSEILPEAQILTVADVVEAIASHRPYRPAHGVDVALDEIAKNKGILYDPEAVIACLHLFEKKGYRLS